MAQSSEIKLLKRFDQNVEITGTLTVGGVPVSPSSYLTSIPSEYLTQTEGDARYLQTLPSHNHDGSYLKRLGDVTVTNFDTLPEGVLGSNETDATNQPYANHHITLTLYNDASAGRRAQLFFADSDVGGLWYRPRQGDTTGWHPWQEIVTSNNIGNYALTSLPSHTHDYVSEGGVDFNGEYPMVVRTGADTIYSNAGILYRGSDDRLSVGGYIYTPRIDISNSTNGGNFNGSNEWGVRFNTNNGYIQLGPANDGHAHIYTDRPDFYFNKELYVNGGKVWHSGNDGSGSALDADRLDGEHGSYYDHRRYTDSNNYLGGYYVSGGTEKPNSSVFGAGKLKIAMLRGGSPNLGFGGTWNDVLWISTYNGGDVKRSSALVFSKYDNTSVYIVKQSYDASDWGTGYLFWNSGNDGPGSGLNADLLDGYQESNFFRSDLGQIGNNDLAFGATTGFPNQPRSGVYNVDHVGYSSNLAVFNGSGSANTVAIQTHYDGSMYVHVNIDGNQWQSDKIWTSQNDGASSGLDADLLDGLQGSQYLRSDTSDTFGGNLTVNGTLNVSGYADFQGDAAIGGGSGYGYFKGYTSNWNHLMTCRGIISGSTSSPSITGGHQQTFVEYVDDDNTGWFFKSSDSGTYYEKVSFRRTYNIFQEDVRAPLFYDKDDTSRYINPAGPSRMGAIGDEYSGGCNVMYPQGARYGSNSKTGAFKITLPQSWTNTMMKLVISIYEYEDAGGFDIHCGGYNYAGNGGYWTNCYAYTVGQVDKDRNFNVRFGHDGSKCVIYIGETNTSWGYPKIFVKSFEGGHSGFSYTNWDDNWDISVVTDIASNIDVIRNLNQIGRYVDRLYDRDNNSYSLKPSAQSMLSTLSVGSTTLGDGVFAVRGGDMIIDRGKEIRWTDSTGSGEYIYSKTSSPYDVTIHSGAYDALQCPNTGQVRINYQGSQKFVTTSSGVSITGSMTASGDVIAYSDERVKENVKTIDNALEKVNKLRGVEYNKIGEEKQHVGVIAQEVEKILPQVVTEDEEGMKGVAYGNIVGVLIEAIKEQQKQIDELKSLINKS
jgi:hypothetical protein